MPETRKQMIERGSLFGFPSFYWLPAKAQISVHFCAFVTSAEVKKKLMLAFTRFWDSQLKGILVEHSGVCALWSISRPFVFSVILNFFTKSLFHPQKENPKRIWVLQSQMSLNTLNYNFSLQDLFQIWLNTLDFLTFNVLWCFVVSIKFCFDLL